MPYLPVLSFPFPSLFYTRAKNETLKMARRWKVSELFSTLEMKETGLLNLPVCKELTLREADNGVTAKREEL